MQLNTWPFLGLLFLTLNTNLVRAMDIQEDSQAPILVAEYQPMQNSAKKMHDSAFQKDLDTDLFMAIKWKWGLEVCETLIRQGANVNTCPHLDPNGLAPIHLAIVRRKITLLNLLLKHGARLDVQTVSIHKIQIVSCEPYLGEFVLAAKSTPFHILGIIEQDFIDTQHQSTIKTQNILLFHALFFGVGLIKNTKESCQSTMLPANEFVAMLHAPDAPTRCVARRVLDTRVATLKHILGIKDALGNIAATTLTPDKLDADLPIFIGALEARALKTLDQDNLFKRAYDAMEEDEPSSCVIS